jgi:hypothetical protein
MHAGDSTVPITRIDVLPPSRSEERILRILTL